MKLPIICLSLSAFLSIAVTSWGQDHNKKESSIPTVTITQIEQQAKELMADRVKFKKKIGSDEQGTINQQLLLKQIEQESILYPADELYEGHWVNKWVDASLNGSLSKPDSCRVDFSSFCMPINKEKIKITSKYGPRRRRMHYGIDLKVYVGDSIYAAFSGKVRIRNYERRGYGKYLVIRHPNGLETVYGHLSKCLVDTNQIVHAGDLIGLGGNTGRSTGSHLHFETRFLGRPINPSEFIDFKNQLPYQREYVLRNIKIRGRKTRMYTTSTTEMVYHRVKSGDSLGKIARIYGTSISQLCYLNGLRRSSILRIGQSIRCSIKVSPKKKKSVSKGNKIEKKQTSKKQIVSSVKKVSKSKTTSSPKEDATIIYHRIKSGDTLSEIATKYGTTVTRLCRLNGISRSTILRLGRKLRCS